MNHPHASEEFDLIVIGGGPAGQKAAVHGAKAGRRVLLVEQEAQVGGECLHHGTIPSKTLRETAVYMSGLRTRIEGAIDLEIPNDAKVSGLMRRLQSVLDNQHIFLGNQLERNGVERWRGRATFVDEHEILVRGLKNSMRWARGEFIVIGTGSRPRNPAEFEVDHEHILDSDSILSLIYLPKSLAILGAGVIACEFASIFASLGVEVTMIDDHARPIGFLEPELTDAYVEAFEAYGGRFLPNENFTSVEWDGVSRVVTKLQSGEEIRTEKLLCALGRVANVRSLDLEAAGLEVNGRGHIPVDEHLRTTVPHIYAVGNVVGPPALAATALEQGRRAACHAFGFDVCASSSLVPIGIYTIPEISSVGMTEAQAREAHGDVLLGYAPFCELARGHISGNTNGLLKLVVHPEDHRLLGVHIVGEGATELIHVGQMAIAGEFDVHRLVEAVFNFPTLAEAYRVAALDVVGQQAMLKRAS